jgi:tRNA (guanine37-N1)-methyltransferase
LVNASEAGPFVVDVVTLFPEMFAALTQSGVTRRALETGRWSLQLWNPRDFTHDRHRSVDDRPYGGGPGMVMMPAPLEAAIEAARARQQALGVSASRVICLSPQGPLLTHARVLRLAQAGEALLLVCGRYEGIDERFIARCVDEEISIGDFVLSGGEIPAMALLDAVVRQLPGVLNDAESAQQDSFVAGLLDCPHYTRPEEYARAAGAGGAALRSPRGDTTLAPATGAGSNVAATSRVVGGRALSKSETQLLVKFQEQCGQDNKA